MEMFFNGRKIIISVLLGMMVWPTITSAIPRYDRREWKHWIDEDGDCQNTRSELLIVFSQIPVTFKDERHCQVGDGKWQGPYTGLWFRHSSEIQIDHLVPLKHAHDSGGFRWSAEEKEIFANDTDNLFPVQARENRMKSSKGPDEYRPPNREFWCVYALRWRHVKQKYHLEVSESEELAIEEMLREGRCSGSEDN